MKEGGTNEEEGDDRGEEDEEEKEVDVTLKVTPVPKTLQVQLCP